MSKMMQRQIAANMRTTPSRADHMRIGTIVTFGQQGWMIEGYFPDDDDQACYVISRGQPMVFCVVGADQLTSR
jgi:hypothetical protein